MVVELGDIDSGLEALLLLNGEVFPNVKLGIISTSEKSLSLMNLRVRGSFWKISGKMSVA